MSIAAGQPRGGTTAQPAPPVDGAPPVEAARSAALTAAPPLRYVGLVTRAIAFTLDAAVVNAVALLTASVVVVTLSVVSVPEAVRTTIAAIGGALYVAWTVGYFATFWATTGQTPGSRVLGIRVCAASGEPLRPRRALVRFAALALATLPMLAGLVLILVDDRRRGLHDVLARSVVIEAED